MSALRIPKRLNPIYAIRLIFSLDADEDVGMKFAHAVCLSVYLFTSKIGFAFNRAFIYHYALDYQQDQEFVDRHDHVACVLWLARAVRFLGTSRRRSRRPTRRGRVATYGFRCSKASRYSGPEARRT